MKRRPKPEDSSRSGRPVFEQGIAEQGKAVGRAGKVLLGSGTGGYQVGARVGEAVHRAMGPVAHATYADAEGIGRSSACTPQRDISASS
ncbi:MAG TPA: hypothetical protein VKV79_03580 [Terriglobia bacterium]|nr:hypothetical protein [Terriglobia bacterium]